MECVFLVACVSKKEKCGRRNSASRSGFEKQADWLRNTSIEDILTREVPRLAQWYGRKGDTDNPLHEQHVMSYLFEI